MFRPSLSWGNYHLRSQTFYLMMDNNGLAPNSEALQGKLECLAN